MNPIHTIRTVRNWSIAGFIVIVMLGWLYHYVFEWSQQSLWVGTLVPVNESVWEHLKLGLWGVITFSVVEYQVLRRSVNNYFFAKAIGIVIISLTILVIYYTYTLFLKEQLVLDISSYIIGVLLCQWFCYYLFQSNHSKGRNRAGIILITSTCLLFAFFTYYPPHREIFKDQRNGTYGIATSGADQLHH